MDVLDKLRTKFEERGIDIVVGSHDRAEPGGGKSPTIYTTLLTSLSFSCYSWVWI